jgi:tetratricopeptide (TPR) repeat protein
VSRLKVDRATDADFHQIVRDIVDFWGSDRTLRLHNAMYVHELVDTSYVIKEGDRVIAYLFGVIAESKKVAAQANLFYSQYREHAAETLKSETFGTVLQADQWTAQARMDASAVNQADTEVKRAIIKLQSEIGGVNTTVAAIEAQLQQARYYLDNTTLVAPEERHLLESLADMLAAHVNRGRAEAVRIYRDMKQPPRDFYLAALDGLFQLLRRRGEALDEATAIFHECMRNMVQMLGPDHPSLGPQMLGYAQALGERNRAVEAIPLLIEGLRISHKAPRESNAAGEWDSAPAVQRLERLVRRIVVRPGASVADYETALAGATTLCEEQAAGLTSVALRGMALFRLRRLDAALLDLMRDAELSLENHEYAVQRLACLAMTQHQLGRIEAARETMAEVRTQVAAHGDAAGTEALGKETLALFGEAEALLAPDRDEN